MGAAGPAMRLLIAAAGRLKAGPEKALFDDYVKRLSWPLTLREVEARGRLSGAELKIREGEMLLAALDRGAKGAKPGRRAGRRLLALDERGSDLTSPAFATRLAAWRDQGAEEIAFVIGTHWFLQHTRPGLAIRALSQDMGAARMMGIRVPRMVFICFLIGSALAGVAGVFIGYKYGHLNPYSGFLPGVKAFVAAVIGGIGSFPGAVVGGIILGLLEVFLVGYLPDALAQFRDAYVFLVLILVLLIRPSGLFGRAVKEKV